MLKTSGIISLTLRENLRSQLLWSSAVGGAVILILVGVLSGIALSHESRVIDVFSYFAADQILLLVAILSGASICVTDFSSRGLAELFVPAGIPRYRLYVARLQAYATLLLALAVQLYALKILVLPYLADHPKPTPLLTHLSMLFFSWLKSIAALAISAFLGSLVRPLFAVLAAYTLFSFGHLTASFDALLNTAELGQSQEHLSGSSEFLYKLLKVWNPNLLVIDSLKGEWIQPDTMAILTGLLWALGVILISTALAIGRINRLDIRS